MNFDITPEELKIIRTCLEQCKRELTCKITKPGISSEAQKTYIEKIDTILGKL